MTKEHGLQMTNFFWSSHENQATRRSYLMNELKNNYRTLEYSSLRKEEETFKRMQIAVAEASQDKKKSRSDDCCGTKTWAKAGKGALWSNGFCLEGRAAVARLVPMFSANRTV